MGKKWIQQRRRERRSKFRHRRISSSPSVINEDDGIGRTTDEEREGQVWQNAAAYDDYSSIANISQTEEKRSSSSSLLGRNTSYINVAPLPIFHGVREECPVAHLTRFARVCRANNVSTTDTILNIFPVTLVDEASLWYELTIEPNPSLTWFDIKSIFLDTYRRPEESRTELMSMKQKSEESVKSYYMRLQWLLIKLPEHGLRDEVLKGIFVDGLKDKECYNWIVLQRPRSLDEAFAVACAWERTGFANRRIVQERVAAVKCGFCEGLHEESGCVLRRKMRELWFNSRNTEESKEMGGKQQQQQEHQKQCKCWKHECWKKFDRSTSAPINRASSSKP